MNDFLRYQRMLFLLILGITAAGAVGLFVALPDAPAYAVGFLAGGAAGLVVFRIRALQVARLPDLPPEQWQKAALKSNLFSLAILAATGVVALLVDGIDVFAAIGGMVLERVVLMLDGFLRPGALSEEAAPPAPDPGAATGEQT